VGEKTGKKERKQVLQLVRLPDSLDSMRLAAMRHPIPVPQEFRNQLVPVAERVFWWGQPQEWLDDALRFAAQVMTYGDWNDVVTTLRLLGDAVFCQVLADPPPGVFDVKSWNFWHLHYQREVPPLPRRNL
jgi:hypothetical protein